MIVRLISDARVKPGRVDDLKAAYAALRARVEQEPELLSHQLCEVINDPEHWLIVTEWGDMEAAQAWSRSEDHARLIGPMAACFDAAEQTVMIVRDGVRR